jgi:hypothetical protein
MSGGKRFRILTFLFGTTDLCFGRGGKKVLSSEGNASNALRRKE